MKLLDKRLDALWRKAVKLRDKKCRRCGNEKNLDAHHIYSRRNLCIRWDIYNGITLCRTCHNFSHSHPEEFRKWLFGEAAGLKQYLEQTMLEHKLSGQKVDRDMILKQLKRKET